MCTGQRVVRGSVRVRSAAVQQSMVPPLVALAPVAASSARMSTIMGFESCGLPSQQTFIASQCNDRVHLGITTCDGSPALSNASACA